jgi:hypothetical protein
MPNAKVSAVCDKVKFGYSTAVTKNPYASALALGNLYLLLDQNNPQDQEPIKKTLIWVHEKTDAKMTLDLWDAIHNLGSDRIVLMHPGNKAALDQLKKQMLTDVLWVQNLDQARIISAGLDLQWYPFIFVGLIRKHYQEHKLKDPITEGVFTLDALAKENREQNFATISAFVKSCKTLFPVDALVLLGKNNQTLAKWIMHDIKDSSWYFTISSQLVAAHPAIANTVAQDWNTVIQTIPHTSAENIAIASHINVLKPQNPSFAHVTVDAKADKDPQLPKGNPQEIANPLKTIIVGMGTGAGALAQQGWQVPLIGPAITYAYPTAALLLPSAAGPLIGATLGASVGLATHAIIESAGLEKPIIQAAKKVEDSHAHMRLGVKVAANQIVQTHEYLALGIKVVVNSISGLFSSKYQFKTR